MGGIISTAVPSPRFGPEFDRLVQINSVGGSRGGFKDIHCGRIARANNYCDVAVPKLGSGGEFQPVLRSDEFQEKGLQ